MLITAYIPISKAAGKKLLAAIFGFGVCIIIFGISSIFWVSVIALFFSGVTDGVSMVIRQTILQSDKSRCNGGRACIASVINDAGYCEVTN